MGRGAPLGVKVCPKRASVLGLDVLMRTFRPQKMMPSARGGAPRAGRIAFVGREEPTSNRSARIQRISK